MDRLRIVLNCYFSCRNIEQKVVCLQWARRILKGVEVERLVFMLKNDLEFDLVIKEYSDSMVEVSVVYG